MKDIEFYMYEDEVLELYLFKFQRISMKVKLFFVNVNV